MKLKNKKTVEIVPASNIAVGVGDDGKWYDSLSELNEEWEDVKEEEPKVYWYIMSGGETRCIEDINNDFDKEHKEIGNYFETKEQAEKAVEKLKAWKRLKDKGFEFGCWYGGSRDISFYISQEKLDKETAKDLDLLFCGEDD